jgi:hypothetical protein
MRNAYNIIRKIHLYAAFSILGFLLMYFITGLMMSHEEWFSPSDPKDLSKDTVLNIPSQMTEEQLSVYVQNTFKIHAQREKPETKEDGTINFRYLKPGEAYTITVSPGGSATLKGQRLSAYRTITGFHRLNGYGGGWVYDLYVLMMDVTSFALIVFALSGVYLWCKLIRKRTWGLIILSSAILYTIIIITLFMNR